MTDPLATFAAGAFVAQTHRPLLCVETRFDVDIEAGIAVVQTRRRFRNDESESVEATITFPVPVHSTLFSLSAKVDGRTLMARARRRSDARGAYEEALGRGKTSVLHEELLRGVHMVSVGHIPAGAEIEVTSIWATVLTSIGACASVRIPLTVGDIYGRSPLPASDDLLHGGPNQMAELTVRSTDGIVRLATGYLSNGRAQVPLNAPIDISVDAWKPRDIVGQAADGRAVALRVEPQDAARDPVDLALLIDRSGSMADQCTDTGTLSKHDAVVQALRAVASCLTEADRAEVWEFSDELHRIGAATTRSDTRLNDLATQLSAPAGGTQIGRALSGVLAQSRARDILLVTDGKSHALDIQHLAGIGPRISVVLVGEDSLEANVGYLATLTGGDIFVSGGSDLRELLVAALLSLRRRHVAPARTAGDISRITVSRNNNLVHARWGNEATRPESGVLGRAVSALATSLVLPSLDEERASVLAEAEGLVTHLTSLVLVDEMSVPQEGLPSMRKIALPSPESWGEMDAVSAPFSISRFSPGSPRQDVLGRPGSTTGLADSVAEDRLPMLMEFLMGYEIDLSQVFAQVPWERASQRLIEGDLSALDARTANLIRQAARVGGVVRLARQVGLPPETLVVGLVALLGKPATRQTIQIAQAILGAEPSAEVVALGSLFNL